MLEAPPPATRVNITLDELGAMQRDAAAQPVPGHIHRTMAEIRRQLGKKQIVASDRRYRQSLALMKAHSYLAGDAQVSDQSLLFLEHVLWREPSEKADIGAVIREIVLGYEKEAQELLYQAREDRGVRAAYVGHRGACVPRPSSRDIPSSATSSAE